MVVKNDIRLLDNKNVYDTSNADYVLSRDFEKVISSPEYKILGFLNNFIYSSSGEYLTKSTINGMDIIELKLNVDHATFYEGVSYFYAYADNTMYQITENMNINWTKKFQTNIHDIVMDKLGNAYVIFEIGGAIQKILNTGENLLYIDSSNDVTKSVKLHKQFLSKGGSWLYVLGSQFWDYDDKVEVFIDKYDAKKGIKLNRQVIESNNGVTEEDPLYDLIDFYVKNDYIYLYARQYIRKINIKGIQIWTHLVGYNEDTKSYNEYSKIEYSDNPYEEIMYFVESMPETNGIGFGKLQLNGKELWRISMPESNDSINFNLCSYENKIYTSMKTTLQLKSKKVLSLDNNRVLFKITDGSLVELVEYNDAELNSSNNYYGRYLIGDRIKDGIDRVVYVPLMHDTGHVVNEDTKILLIAVPASDDIYSIESNYDYFQLESSQYSTEANVHSILRTKTGRMINTKLNNIIKTKVAYEPESVYDYLISKDGDILETLDNTDLIRARAQYAYNKKLLADRNKFFDYIKTKSDEYIITKKYGHRLVKKTRHMYKYVLSKYDDIDLVREWLIQNGVLNTLLPKYVDELRHHTVNMIEDIQVAGIPTVYDIQATKVFSYTYDGIEYANNTWGTQIFICNNLPFNKRLCKHTVFIDSIANMVKNKEVRPFLIFLNGKAVKWSNCSIIKDWNYTYLIISETNPADTDIECVVFPCNIKYGEDNNILDQDEFAHLYFDKDGLLTENADNIAFRIEVIDDHVIGETLDYSNEYIEVNNEYTKLATEKNILVFENSKLFSDSKYYIQEHGKDIFTYLRDADSAIFKTFYYTKSNDYYGLLYKIPNGSATKANMINKAKGQEIPTLYDNFMPPFDFKLYRNKTYDVNVADAVKYIMNYDMSLLVQYYKDQCNMKAYTYTGLELMKMIPEEGGYLVLPRGKYNGLEEYVIVFRNNELYEFNKQITYSPTEFKIPIFNHVEPDDIIEILHFMNVDNSYYSLIVNENMDYLPSNLRYDNFLLFGNSPSGKQAYDTFSVENSIQYDIDFNYKNNFDSNGKYSGTTIKLADPYYNDKLINICSKRQFRHMYYNIFFDRTSFDLSPDFRFCHEKNRYLVFVNNIRLQSSDWTLNIMSTGNERKYVNITTKQDLHFGDRIEIFYLPDSFEEVSISNNNSKKYGDICVEMDDLGYSFDKDLFMIFVNGHMINYNFIENINNHRIRIKNDSTSNSGLQTIHNITVLKFLQPGELLGKLWSYSDKWSNATDALSSYEYHELLTNKIKK